EFCFANSFMISIDLVLMLCVRTIFFALLLFHYSLASILTFEKYFTFWNILCDKNSKKFRI
ncbi:hypothetical protein ACFLYK_02835, partial [Candidatus Cloacimonadota bacterium]